MNTQQFRNLLGKNADLRSSILSILGAPCGISEEELPGFVRYILDYATFRPFDSLGQTEKLVATTTRHGELSTQTMYEIFFHIEAPGEAVGSRRIGFSDNPENGQPTIRKCIEKQREWHQIFWAKQGTAMRFDAVMKRTTTWRISDERHQLGKIISQSLDIYRFPDYYTIPGNVSVPAA